MLSSDLFAFMSYSAWLALTSLGSSVLMIPAALIVVVRLIAASAWRVAFWWTLWFATAVGLVLVSKVAFLGWGIGIRSLDFTGISGHAMLATAVLPVLGHLLVPGKIRAIPMPGALCGLVLSLAVGISRCVLGMHSPAEVVAGFGLGALVALAFIRLSGIGARLVLLDGDITALLVLLAAFHFGYGNQINAHGFVVKIAQYASGRERPYSRVEWQLGDKGVNGAGLNPR